MITLYLDTSSSFLYIGLLKDNKLIDEVKENLNKDLSSYTLPKLDELLKYNNISIDNIGKIVTVNGPGSFTGIRIGLTIAKTLAWAKKIPIIQISSLYAMALSYEGTEYNYLIPAIDARRGYVFGTIYDVRNNNFVLKEQYISLKTLEITTNSLSGKIGYISNDELDTNLIILKYNPNIERIVNSIKEEKLVNPHSVDANYLKLTEAEENKIKNDC